MQALIPPAGGTCLQQQMQQHVWSLRQQVAGLWHTAGKPLVAWTLDCSRCSLKQTPGVTPLVPWVRTLVTPPC
jgi:hypothetical protein